MIRRLVALLVLLCVVAPASAVAEPSASKPLPVPTAFRLEGTNGFTVYVIGEAPRAGSKGSLRIITEAKRESVFYSTPATMTETSIHADLGELGEISVNFQRSGKVASVRCGNRPIKFDSGNWVGTIAFHGEEGYTNVEATTVPGNAELLLEPFCGGSESYGGSSERRRGAELSVRNPALGPELTVRKSRPGAAAVISARLSEYENGISIERTVARWIPGTDFVYDSTLRTATVTPPAPFSGSAQFDLGEKAGRRWSGDLTADFPGRSDVALAGPLLRATLSPSE
jgi:hypothetical protein